MDNKSLSADQLYAEARNSFEHYEVVKDVIDECIDMMLNHRQSGHPGGSRSKVHMLVAALLSGAMRWDILQPWKRYGDRLVLSAGHTVPLIYATLATLNEVMRARHERDGGAAFSFPEDGKYALTWEDLLEFRNNKGLAGHAEVEGKTLLLKSNTGPSGHGMPPAAGQALALKAAGCEEVKVFVIEGEGGLTPGSSHETKNSAWGLGLSNLVFMIDWNDFGIDNQTISSVVSGTPATWFESYGWKVAGTEQGSEWADVTRVMLEAARGENPDRVPSAAWFKTRKGRGYLKYDNVSHGAPHARNSEKFWTLRKAFMKKYGVEYAGVDQAAPADPAEMRAQAEQNYRVAMSVLRNNDVLVTALSDRLAALAASVPVEIGTCNLGKNSGDIFKDERLYDFKNYPADIWAKPGETQPNRKALGVWGAYINSLTRETYDRPLFITCSADLAGSTNIGGFADGHGDIEGWGNYDRDKNIRGTVLPQEITEFTNAGICAGVSSVNLAEDPMRDFNGFWTACSTYGSFSYLKYGPMRMFSQQAQDCDLEMGKVIWVAGHSGPETADDSRTHFGIYAPSVTQLFPAGHVIDLHPWEYNEVPVVLGAALRLNVPIIALHLTRPGIKIPDREALGMASHFEAARGAYIIRQFDESKPKMGTVFVQGTMSTANLVKVLPELDKAGINVKIVAAISPQLFNLEAQAYQDQVASTADRWDAMTITNRSLKSMSDWIAHPVVADYSLSSDWDDRWRTGGTLDQVIEEAHLTTEDILNGIERFAKERTQRLKTLRDAVEVAERHS
jgi:transketolase